MELVAKAIIARFATKIVQNLIEHTDLRLALDEAGIEIPFPYITHTFKERVPMGSEPGESA